jgi:hypothetical protein
VGRGIPDKGLIRTGETSRNRMDSLMKVPMHKSGTSKFDSSTDFRSINPLTSEDIAQFGNLGLMSTLRQQQPTVTSARTRANTIDNPPSFYDNDIRKKQEKY